MHSGVAPWSEPPEQAVHARGGNETLSTLRPLHMLRDSTRPEDSSPLSFAAFSGETSTWLGEPVSPIVRRNSAVALRPNLDQCGSATLPGCLG